MTHKTAKIPFDLMDGVPASDDREVNELAEVIASLPDHNVESFIRGVYRAMLGWERTGNPEVLASFADGTLVTTRLRRDPETDRALREAPTKPAAPEDSVNVEDALRERGLL